MGFITSQQSLGSPILTLDVASPNIRLRNISFYVEPANWLAGLLWRFLRMEGMVTWSEEPLEG